MSTTKNNPYGLSDAMVMFCHEYVTINNATKAYMIAYPGSSEAAARSSASTHLSKSNIQQYIADLKKQRIEETGIEIRDVLERLWGTVTADPNELIEIRRDCCRHCYGDQHRYQYTMGEWDALMVRWEADCYKATLSKIPPPPEPDLRGGIGFNRRLPPDPGCPECFGEGVEDVFIKDTRYLSPAARELYAGVKVTKGGIEIQKHSRDKAIELLGRYHAMFTDNLNHKNNGGSFEPMKLQDFYADADTDSDQTSNA